MIEFDDFFPFIETNAVSAPEPLVERCIRRAAIRFCERTRLWRVMDSIVTNGLDPEPIAVPNDAVLFEISECSIDGKPLDPISISELALERPKWRTEDVGSGGARWYVSTEIGTVQVVPRSAGTVNVECVVKPAQRADTLPDFLFDLYAEDIAAGASAYVLATPNAAFSNPQVAGALNMNFEMRLNALFDAGRRGQQKARARARASYF